MKRSFTLLVLAMVLGAGLAGGLAGLVVKPSSLQLAELKTVITPPPPPPPPVDSGTVDLRDKKEPLIPHIPAAAAPGVESHVLAGIAPDNRTIFNPAPPPPPPVV